MSVVPHRPQPVDQQPRWVALLTESAQLARMIANTDFVPKALRGNEAAIAATILYGDEVGLPPMQALAHIAVIDGKPSLAAETQRALIQAAGHSLHGQGTTTKFTWTGTRADTGDTMEFTWTMDDAKRAGIAGKQNWRTYPRAMLSARASAELARALFADIIGGLAAVEELEDTGPAIEGAAETPTAAPAAAAAPAGATRKRANVAAPIIAPTPAPPDAPPLPPLPDDYPTPPAPKATDAQLKKLFALFREKGYGDSREARLEWTNQQLDRTVETAGDLTDTEASVLITALEAAPAAPPVLTDPEQPQFDLKTDPVDSPVSTERVDMLMWMRGEAGVTDDWMRAKLAALGVQELPKRITRDVLNRLTRSEALVLSDALSNEVDARATRAE